MSMDWTAIAAGAAVVYNVIVLVSVVLLWRQLNEIRKANDAQSYFEILRSLQAVRDQRGRVYALASKPLAEWQHADVSVVEEVASSYDVVGMLARRGMVPLGLIVDSWGDSLRKTWPIAQPLVEKYRVERNAPEFWDDFQFLAEEAFARRSRR